MSRADHFYAVTDNFLLELVTCDIEAANAVDRHAHIIEVGWRSRFGRLDPVLVRGARETARVCRCSVEIVRFAGYRFWVREIFPPRNCLHKEYLCLPRISLLAQENGFPSPPSRNIKITPPFSPTFNRTKLWSRLNIYADTTVNSPPQIQFAHRITQTTAPNQP